MLDITLKDLEKVLDRESYIVIDAKETGLARAEMLSEERYMQLVEEYGEDKFQAGMGGEAILEMLKQVDVHTLSETLRQEMRTATSEAKRKTVDDVSGAGLTSAYSSAIGSASGASISATAD